MDEFHLYTQPGESQPVLRHYARQVANYRSWQRLSAHLFHSSKIFEPELKVFWNTPIELNQSSSKESGLLDQRMMQLHDTYLMLVGFAIENLLKAVIVRNGSKSIFALTLRTRRLPRYLDKHDLVYCLINSFTMY